MLPFYQNFIKSSILFKIFCSYATIFIHLKYRSLKSQNLNEVRGIPDYHIFFSDSCTYHFLLECWEHFKINFWMLWTWYCASSHFSMPIIDTQNTFLIHYKNKKLMIFWVFANNWSYLLTILWVFFSIVYAY